MVLKRFLSIFLVLACLAEDVFSAEPIEVHLYSYETSLDSRPEAYRKEWRYMTYATEGQFRILQRDFDPRSFDRWAKKLSAVRPDMTIDEVKDALKPKRMGGLVQTGSGIVGYFELDDAYFVWGLFSGEKLKEMPKRPLAMTYGVHLEKNLK